MLSEDDVSVVLALTTRFQRYWRQIKADRELIAEAEKRIDATREQTKKLRTALAAFGFESNVDGWFAPIRDAVGQRTFDEAFLKAGLPLPRLGPPAVAVELDAVHEAPKTQSVGQLAASASVRDLVLERLKAHEKEGIKATDIRAYIEMLRGAKLHDKTIGMTLYRLSLDGLAKRDKRTWFYVPPKAETVNPGGDTPGPNNSVDRKE